MTDERISVLRLHPSGLCNEEVWERMDTRMKECPPSLDLTNSPFRTQTNHIPNMSGIICWSYTVDTAHAVAEGTFLGVLATARGRLSNDDFILGTYFREREGKGEGDSADVAQWVFHVSSHHYQGLESFAVKTHSNEFFHYSSVCGRLQSAINLEMKHETTVDTTGVCNLTSHWKCSQGHIYYDLTDFLWHYPRQ